MIGDILIVHPKAFHQGWLGSTSRLFHLGKAFQRLGFRVVLLAGKMTNPQLQTPIDESFPGVVLRSRHSGSYPSILDISPRMRRVWRALWKVRGRDYYMAQLSFGWGRTLNIDWVVDEIKRKRLNVKIVWGVCGGLLDGGVAANRIAQAMNIPWVFELQDPPVGAGLAPESVAIRREFIKLLKSSSCQVTVTDSYRQHLIEEFALSPQRVAAIHLTFDGKIINQRHPCQGSRFSLFYGGSLHRARSLAPLLRGVVRALELQHDMHQNLLIQIAGIGEGLEEAKSLIRMHEIESIAQIYGLIPKESADKLACLANALVVAQSVETSRFQIPGKIYELMRLNKPILAIMPPECEAAAILRRSGLGFVHHPDDINGIAETLIKLWSDWRAGRPSVQINRDYVSQFSVRHLPEKLRPLLEGLL